MSLPNDAYNHTVEKSTDGVTDSYLVGGSRTYSFPTGTSLGVVYVTIAIQENLILFNNSLTDFINARYGLETRVRWTTLYLECQYFSRPNRMAYIGQLLTWGDAISQYTSDYITALLAMVDPAAIAAKVPDFSAFDKSDPKINLLTCMQIVG